MKKYYFCFFVLLLTTTAQRALCQIPNPSFESWSGSDPDGWISDNLLASGTTTKSSTAHQGSNGVRMSVVEALGGNGTIGGQLYTGTQLLTPGRFHISSAPVALHGWYIASVDSGDDLGVASNLFNGNTVTAGGILKLNTNTSVYKEFVLTYSYIGSGSDSGTILFQVENTSNNNQPHVTTHFIIDDLSFGGSASGVEDVNPAAVSLEQNSPNPAVSQTNIIYSVQATSQVTLTITDILGRTVKTVVNEKQSPGRYKAIVDVNDLPAGNYFYQVNAGGNVASHIMAVVK